MAIIPEDKEYKDLGVKVRKYQRIENVSDNIGIISLFLLFFPIMAAVVVAGMLNYTLNIYFSPALVAFGFVLITLVIRWKNRQLGQYKVDSREWLNYYVYPAHTSLEKYLKEEAPGMKEDFRKNAIGNLRELTDAITRRWTVGGFSPAKEAVGTAVSDLIDGLNLWAIPTLEKEDEKQMHFVSSFVTSLYWLSKGLNIPRLVEINSRFKGNVENSKKEKKGLWDKIKSHRNVKWLVPVGVIILIYFALLYHLMTFWKLDFTGSSVGIGALFAVIFAAIRLFKEKKD